MLHPNQAALGDMTMYWVADNRNTRFFLNSTFYDRNAGLRTIEWRLFPILASIFINICDGCQIGPYLRRALAQDLDTGSSCKRVLVQYVGV